MSVLVGVGVRVRFRVSVLVGVGVRVRFRAKGALELRAANQGRRAGAQALRAAGCGLRCGLGAVGGGRWAVGGGRWVVDGGRWAVGGGLWGRRFRWKRCGGARGLPGPKGWHRVRRDARYSMGQGSLATRPAGVRPVPRSAGVRLGVPGHLLAVQRLVDLDDGDPRLAQLAHPLDQRAVLRRG